MPHSNYCSASNSPVCVCDKEVEYLRHRLSALEAENAARFLEIERLGTLLVSHSAELSAKTAECDSLREQLEVSTQLRQDAEKWWKHYERIANLPHTEEMRRLEAQLKACREALGICFDKLKQDSNCVSCDYSVNKCSVCRVLDTAGKALSAPAPLEKGDHIGEVTEMIKGPAEAGKVIQDLLNTTSDASRYPFSQEALMARNRAVEFLRAFGKEGGGG